MPTEVPDGAVRISPGAPYRLWWSEVEQCTGQRRDFATVRWYMMPGVSHFIANSAGGPTTASGVTSGDLSTITIAEGALLKGPLVRHEMAHAITGVLDHPASLFTGSCEGFVVCEGACLVEAGVPFVDTLAPLVPARSLQLDMTVIPDTVRFQDGGGWLTVVVTARNPFANAARFVLTDVPGANMRHLFGYSGGGWGEIQLTDSTSIGFRAGEVRRWAFDVRAVLGPVTSSISFPMRGAFDSDSTAAVSVVVAPD